MVLRIVRGIILVSFIFVRCLKANDSFVDELRDRCNTTRKVFHCSKYRLVRYIDNFTLQPETVPRSLNRYVRLVEIQQPEFESRIFSTSRYFGDDSEFLKVIKFGMRKAEQFLNRQGIAVTLPRALQVVDVDEGDTSLQAAAKTLEPRGKKQKKKQLIIPMIILAKLLKIKMLLAMVLSGLIIIKKIFLMTALLLPSIINNIKNHCKTAYHVFPHYHQEEEHDHGSTGTGWGYAGYGSNPSSPGTKESLLQGFKDFQFPWSGNSRVFAHTT